MANDWLVCIGHLGHLGRLGQLGQLGRPFNLRLAEDGSQKYVIGAPAMSMKELAAITLAPKMIAKLKAEVKALKQRIEDRG